MQESKEDHRPSTLIRSAIAISTVVIVELTIGTVVGSLAILSDGLHALLDALMGFTMFFATRASIRPPDEEHMYGHEKLDTLGGLVGGFALIGAAILIMFEASQRVMQNREYFNHDMEFVGFIAIGYTLCVDLYRVVSFSRTRKSESSSMRAGRYDAVADLTATTIALGGFSLATAGFYYSDSIASVFLGIFLIYLSARLIWRSGMELSDAIPKDVAEMVKKEILKNLGVSNYRNLRIRRAGDKTFVRVVIQVPEFLSLEEAHTLTQRIEENLEKVLGNVETSIHIEPPETQSYTQKKVEEIAAKVEGVKDAHEVAASYTDNKLYITLHVQVEPKLSVQETHAIAERIENEILGTVNDVEKVTVHTEPYNAKSRKGPTVSDIEISKTIHKIAGGYGKAFKMKNLLTYVAKGRLNICIEGYFNRQTSIEDAHEIASEIEGKIRERFADTIVTVHIEPEPA
jgi:cation diffusion facilitator family transporter